MKLNRHQIRERYNELRPLIDRGDRIDPYSVCDWCGYFTPIEENVWSDIRYVGLPMLPQYPVDGFFIDFADPLIKLGIEVDGKIWHTNKEKDAQRQDFLERRGWTIIRIDGRQTYKEREDYFPDDYKEIMSEREIERTEREYESDCSEGILRWIKRNYY